MGILYHPFVRGTIVLFYCLIILSIGTSEVERSAFDTFTDTTTTLDDSSSLSRTATAASSSLSSSSAAAHDKITTTMTTVTNDNEDYSNPRTRTLAEIDDTLVYGGTPTSSSSSASSTSSSSSSSLLTNISFIVRQPPSWSVSTTSNAQGKTLTILIMTHKRPQGIEKLLNYIYNTSLASGLYVPDVSATTSSTVTLPIHIIIAQSAAQDNIILYERAYRSVQDTSSTTVTVPDCSSLSSISSVQVLCETRTLLEKYSSFFTSVRHVFTPYVQYDTSISNNYHTYGSMHNALRNLYHGLYIAFHTLSSHDQYNLIQLIHQHEESTGTTTTGTEVSSSSSESLASSSSSPSLNSMEFTTTITKLKDGLLRKALTAAEMAQNTLNDIAKRKKYKDLVYTLYDEEDIFKNIVASEDLPVSSSASSPSTLDYISQKLPREVLVMEDDAELTDDALAYFTAAANIMKQHDHHVDFATGYVLYRPNMVVGTMDIDLLHSYRAYYNMSTSATVIDRIKATPRIVFKTFAWMLTRKGWYTQLRTVMENLANSYVPSVAPTILNRTKQQKFRSIQPEFQGCVWCYDYCYDHLIEWILQDNTFLAPAIPRIRQTAGQGGMTYTENSVNYMWDGKPVYDPAAYTLHSGLMTMMRIFQTIGYSGIAVMRPNSIEELVGNSDGNGDAIELRIDRVEIARILLSEPLISFLLLCAAVLSVFVAISLASWVHQRVITRKLLKAH